MWYIRHSNAKMMASCMKKSNEASQLTSIKKKTESDEPCSLCTFHIIQGSCVSIKGKHTLNGCRSWPNSMVINPRKQAHFAFWPDKPGIGSKPTDAGLDDFGIRTCNQYVTKLQSLNTDESLGDFSLLILQYIPTPDWLSRSTRFYIASVSKSNPVSCL